MEAHDYHEQRGEPRKAYVTFVWYRCLVEAGGAASDDHGIARSCDVSESGCGLVVSKALPVGARIFVEVLSSGGNLSVVGRIMYSVPSDDFFRVGVRIDIVPPTDLMTLARLAGA